MERSNEKRLWMRTHMYKCCENENEKHILCVETKLNNELNLDLF